MTLLRAFVGVETAVLTFRTKQCSTCHSSHICYGKRLYNDFFLDHHKIALVNNCIIFLSRVIIETTLDLMKKKSIILTVSFQLETYHLTSSRTVLNAMMQCMFTDNYNSSFCSQKNYFLFRKKYGLFNSFIFFNDQEIFTVILSKLSWSGFGGGGGGARS